MISRDEILETKQKVHELDEKIGKIGKEQFPSVIRLAGALKEILDGIEGIKQREQAMHDPHVNKRIKLMKQGIKLGKNIKYFEDNIVLEFDAGNLTEEMGKKFVAITKLIKKNQMPVAVLQFKYFEDILDLDEQYAQAKEKLESEEEALQKEEYRIKALQESLLELESQEVDEAKVGEYTQYISNLEKIEKIRFDYLSSLSAESVGTLVENQYLISQLPSPQTQDVSEIRSFLGEYPRVGTLRMLQLTELFSASDAKLSHICAETSKFKRVILENKSFFDNLHNIAQTNFLALNFEDEKVMEFYTKKGAKDILAQIKAASTNKEELKAEYEKHQKIEEKKEELKEYSQEQLEAELKQIRSNLELLNSEYMPNAQSPRAEKGEGFFSRLGSFFKN